MRRPRSNLQPNAIAQLHGNPGHLSKEELTSEPDGIGELWAPPDNFDEDQRAIWNYTLEHAPLGLLTGTDREALVIFCAAMALHSKALTELNKTGPVIVDGKSLRLNPWVRVLDRQAEIAMRAGAEIGFSPLARTALARRGVESINGVTKSNARGKLGAFIDQRPAA